MKTVIFDVDGVLTNTAGIHFRAWLALFDEVLWGQRPFDKGDYDRLVDGKPRLEGLRAVLADRDILDASHVDELAQHKQELFQRVIETEGVDAFVDVVPTLDRLVAAGVPLAAVSASRNGAKALSAARLTDYFRVIVDGVTATNLGINTKLELFSHVVSLVDRQPTDCLLVEDSIAGLRAGQATGFGLVVGLDRSPARNRRLEEFADVVIGSLNELSAEWLKPEAQVPQDQPRSH